VIRGYVVGVQIMASEVGVVDVPHWDIASKGRLMPGNIFLVDFDAGRVIKDEEVRPFLSPYAGASLLWSHTSAAQGPVRGCNQKNY
jgi:hypothetical protein